MEKEILIQNLREKLGEDKASAISDRTFDVMADQWLPLFSDDSAITDATWDMPINLLTAYVGQKRHDDAEYAKALEEKNKTSLEEKIQSIKEQAIEEYKKTLEDPEPPKKTDPKPTDPEPTDMKKAIEEAVAKAIGGLTGEDGVIGKLSATVNDFVTKNKEQQRAQQVQAAKEHLGKYLKGKGASNNTVVEDALLDIEYGETIDLVDLEKKVTSAYEARYKRYFGDGGKPFGGGAPGGSGTNPHVDDAVKAHIEALRKQAADSMSYQETIQKTLM